MIFQIKMGTKKFYTQEVFQTAIPTFQFRRRRFRTAEQGAKSSYCSNTVSVLDEPHRIFPRFYLCMLRKNKVKSDALTRRLAGIAAKLFRCFV